MDETRKTPMFHSKHSSTLPDATAALSRPCLLHYTVEEKTTFTKPSLSDSSQLQILDANHFQLPAM